VRGALARMRVSALRSVKSLTRDRVPAGHRKAVETRYAALLRRVALTTAAVEGTAATVGSSSLSCAAIPATAVLLADVYRLERELIDADKERDRLSSGDGGGLHERFARWFAAAADP